MRHVVMQSPGASLLGARFGSRLRRSRFGLRKLASAFDLPRNDLQVAGDDPARAEKKLGWKARITARELAWIMVDADLAEIARPFPGKGKRFIEEHFDDWHSWENI